MSLIALLIASGAAPAQQLPSLSKAPWLGFFSGYVRRGFEFGVNNEGACEIHLIGKNKKRVGHTRVVKIYPEVIVENDQGKRYYKRLKEDEGFATTQKAGLEHEAVKFTAESTGDAKVEVSIKYDRDRIIFDGKILDRGKLTKGKIYFGFKVLMPAMYSPTYSDEKKAKARMRKDKFRFVRAKDGKRVTLKTYEEVDLNDEKNTKDGVTALEVDMDGQEGKKFLFKTEDGKGKFIVENRYRDKKGKLWKGYYVKWYRELGDETTKPFVIEVK